MSTRRVITAMVSVAVLALGACGGGNEKPEAGGTTASTVGITLQEWSVIPAQASISAGSVTFRVENKGPKHKHEFIILKTDRAPDQLETIPNDGAVNVAAAGLEDLLEIDEFDVGATQTSKPVPLTAGKYIMLCNVSEDPPTADMAGIKAHFKLGMFKAFTVT